jgi:hypothetical protein
MPWGTFRPTFFCNWAPVGISRRRNSKILHFRNTGSASALKTLHFIKQIPPVHKPGGHSKRELLENLRGAPDGFPSPSASDPLAPYGGDVVDFLGRLGWAPPRTALNDNLACWGSATDDFQWQLSFIGPRPERRQNEKQTTFPPGAGSEIQQQKQPLSRSKRALGRVREAALAGSLRRVRSKKPPAVLGASAISTFRPLEPPGNSSKEL